MHANLRRTMVVLAAGVAAPVVLVAQTGSISGKVVDKNSKQPVEQAQVTVEGTSYGVYTKSNGAYWILGVPPGTYNVTAKRVGYQPVQAQNVTVRVDITRTQDFELASTGFRGEIVPMMPSAPRSVYAATGPSNGPGTAFGIAAYECANCGVARYRDSVRAVYTFGAEPVVVAVDNAQSNIKPGDVIVAVNGVPITTRAGADLFAYPPESGELRLTLRRNGRNLDISTYNFTITRPSTEPIRAAGGRGGVFGARNDSLRDQVALCARSAPAAGRSGDTNAVARIRLCASDSLSDRLRDAQRFNQLTGVSADSMLRSPVVAAGASGGGRGGGRGGAISGGGRAGASPAGGVLVPSAPSPAEIVSSVVELRNYGFTLSCRPDCTRNRSRTGVAYWKFDGYPSVAVQMLAKDGLAAKAGIREGDVLISVNGVSPLSEEGAVLLNRSDRELELTLEFSRAGKREKYVLKL